jgi:hypothetical protein
LGKTAPQPAACWNRKVASFATFAVFKDVKTPPERRPAIACRRQGSPFETFRLAGLPGCSGLFWNLELIREAPSPRGEDDHHADSGAVVRGGIGRKTLAALSKFLPLEDPAKPPTIRYNEWRVAMSRHALGDHPMTSSERQRRYLAKLAGPRTAAPAPAGAPPFAAAAGGLPINLEHLRLYPNQVAPWLCQRLGRDVALAFYNALGRALDEATAEETDP